jgi:phosphoglycerol transferase MdoB-like AlkP superfamily enzyme
MYNGNGNGYKGGNYSNIGGFRIKPIYLYIAGIVAVLLVLYFVLNFFRAGAVMHFGAVAGVLLLIANIRELIGQSYGQRGSTALLNVLIGGGLLFAWLAQIVSIFLWIPAILLVGAATPLVWSRANVYNSYLDVARNAVGTVRRTLVK